MIIAKVKKIKWDTDGEDVSYLPKSTSIVVENENDDIANKLSDMYGFCIESIGNVEFVEQPKTLENVLQKYFKVKQPFNLKTDEFTKAGSNAYGKLTNLLYDIGNITDTDMTNIIETLDDICDNKH